MPFRITGLSPEPFRHLFGLDDEELARHGAIRTIADEKPGFPDRIEVRDAEPGEALLLINHCHHAVNNPFRASHAIFVREGATARYESCDKIPDALRIRTISLRAFDAQDMMVNADLVDGKDLEAAIARFFDDPDVSYLHAHYAKRGCYAARIDRT